MNSRSADHSDEKAYRVAYLISGFIRKTLTEAEHNELDAWVEASDENMQLFEELTDENNMEANLAWMEKVQTEKALQETMAQLPFEQEHKVKKRVPLWPYLIAASLVLAIVAIFLFADGTASSPEIIQNTLHTNDVLPGGNRATLSFDDGSFIALEAANKGFIKNEMGTTIEKTKEGELMYIPLNEARETGYNTLSTPKGGQYSLALSDGTRVWLNAQSSLRYPVQFTDSTRAVELSGEGYFEVAKKKNLPFIVRLGPSEEIKVLGTQFNVMAYANEESKKVTLVEGSVHVRVPKKHMVLKPGQQAILSNNGLSLQLHPDLESATGWKNGDFVFHDATIYEIMRQVERWYDMNVIYKITSSEHFNATISRNVPVSRLLHYLELTGKIHFKIENKTIYILP